MAKKLYEESSVQDIANAIREKTGGAETYKIAQMGDAVRAIPFNETVEEWNQVPDTVAEYIAAAESAYTNENGATISIIENYAIGADAPIGKPLPTQPGTRYMQDEALGIGGKVANSIDGASVIYNAIPAHILRYFVLSSGKTLSSGRVKPVGALRMMKFVGYVKNCRDLGGWACDGGKVRYNLLYRCANPRLPEAINADIARNANIKFHFDLRSEGTFTASPFGSTVYYKSYPLSAYYKNVVDLSQAYYPDMVKLLRGVFCAVTHGDGVIYHCALGRDRTGTLSFILLALLGVQKKDVDIDYELSGFSSLLDAGAAPKRTGGNYNELSNYFGTFGMTTLRDNVVKWALKAGITIDEINSFRASAIDGAPAMLNASDYISTYTLTQNLTACTSSTSTTELTEGETLSITVSPNKGKKMQSIAVTMGGVDITATAVSGNIINISAITGDIIITAIAIAAYTNQIPISTDTDGSIYNGVGYQKGYRLNSSGMPSAQTPTYITGFIPCKTGDIIRFKNMGLIEGSSTLSEQRIAFYDSEKTCISTPYWTGTSPTYMNGQLASLVVPSYTTSVAYARFGCYSIDASSIITVNEVIE